MNTRVGARPEILSLRRTEYTVQMDGPRLALIALAMAVAPAVLVGNGALAQGPDYRCVIERIAVANEDRRSIEFRETYIGQEFTVERRTGLMAGALKNSYATEPQVIDMGSAENSYKVVTTMRLEEGAGAGTNAYLLTVNEFADGREKPFMFAQNDVAYFGTCVHF